MTLSEIAELLTLNREECKIFDSGIIEYYRVNSPMTHVQFIDGVKRELCKKYKLVKVGESTHNKVYIAKLKVNETQDNKN